MRQPEENPLTLNPLTLFTMETLPIIVESFSFTGSIDACNLPQSS